MNEDLNHGSAEMADAGANQSPAAPWYRLHALTWVLLAIQLAAIGWARSVADYGLAGSGPNGGFTYYRYGWPLVDHSVSYGSRRDPITLELNSYNNGKLFAAGLVFNLAIYALVLAATAASSEAWLRSGALWQVTIARIASLTLAIAAMLALWSQIMPLTSWLESHEVYRAGLRETGLLPPWFAFPPLAALACGLATVASAGFAMCGRMLQGHALRDPSD